MTGPRKTGRRPGILAGLLLAGWAPAGARADQTAEMEEVEEIEEIEEIEEVELVEVVPAGEEPSLRFDDPNRARVERGINLLLARPTRARSMQLVVDHRAFQALVENPLHDYLGLEAGGMKIGLGLRYGIVDDLDAGFYRLNNTSEIYDTYDFDLRWRVLRQTDHGLDLALRGGTTWFSQPEIEDAMGFSGQLLADRVFADRLLLGLALLFHSESSNDVKSSGDSACSAAVGGNLELRITPGLAWDLEIAANVLGYGASWPVMSTAVKFLTHRHSFSIVLSNNQYMASDGVVANSWRSPAELALGFQILRQFDL